MPNLRVLSGDDIVKIFAKLGFQCVKQKGSHMKFQRTMPDGSRQTLTAPYHKELDTGLLRAIYRQSLRYIPESDLRTYFYTE